MVSSDANEAKVHLHFIHNGLALINMPCKAQLRLTTQRLAQLQEKQHSQRQITSNDIAILLRQGNVALARAKTQNLIQEDTLRALLEVLELYVRLILEHFNEIDQRCHYCSHLRNAADFIYSPTPTPVVVEAASTIIFASPHAGSRGISFAYPSRQCYPSHLYRP